MTDDLRGVSIGADRKELSRLSCSALPEGAYPSKITTMTLNDTLKQLKALGNEKMRAHNTKYGAGDDQFGVKHGDIRVLAKKIRTDHKLAMSLWKTGNVDAQLLAVLLIKPKDLSA